MNTTCPPRQRAAAEGIASVRGYSGRIPRLASAATADMWDAASGDEAYSGQLTGLTDQGRARSGDRRTTGERTASGPLALQSERCGAPGGHALPHAEPAA